jgi:hypothetical protein
MADAENLIDRAKIFESLIKEADEKLRTHTGNQFGLDGLNTANICVAQISNNIFKTHALIYDHWGWRVIANNIFIGIGSKNATLERISEEFAKISDPRARFIWFETDPDERDAAYKAYLRQNKEELECNLIGSLRIGLQGFYNSPGIDPQNFHPGNTISLN